MAKHSEKWVTWLVAALDEYADEETKRRIMERCGEQCQSQSFIRKARTLYENSAGLDDFLARFGQVYPNLHREGDGIFIIYSKCYCPNVNKLPLGRLSATYCNCSRGWAKALFEGALGRPVDVIKEKSIIGGDEECRFRIVL